MKKFKYLIAIVLTITTTLSLFACASQETLDDFMSKLKNATSYTTLLEHFDEAGYLQYARYFLLDGNKAKELPLQKDYTPEENSSYYIIKNDSQYDCIYFDGNSFQLYSGQESENSFISLGRKVESELGYLLKDKYFDYDKSTKTYTLTTDASLIAELIEVNPNIEHLTEYTITVKIEDNKAVITEFRDAYKTVFTITAINSTSITLPSVS